MSIDVVSPLRQRMIEDMTARKLSAGTQRLHISSCKRFAAFLQRSPETATVEDVRRFQLHLAETGTSIPNRNRLMTGLRFLFRVTLRRLDLAAEIYHLREPQKIPQVISRDEARRLLAVANSLRTRLLLSLAYGCGLRASEVIRLKDSFATHLLERGTDIRIIQALLGHAKLDATARYTRVATGMIASIASPLDLLSQSRKKPKVSRKALQPA